MKKIIRFVFICLMIAAPSLASVLTVQVTSSDGEDQIIYRSKKVTRQELKMRLGNIASFDKDVHLYLIVGNKASATTLVQVLHDIQSTGLHNLVLMAPGKEEGKDGMYQITLDVSKRIVGGWGDSVNESGFVENSEFYLEEADQAIEAPASEKKNVTQPTESPVQAR